MSFVKETLSVLGLTIIFDLFRDVIERIKYIFVPPQAFSWQTLIYLSLFSWLMSSLADPNSAVRDIIAFFGWIFLIAGTSWYTTDKPLYVPGTVMPVGAVITGGIVSVFAFRQDNSILVTKTIIFWPTISALITAIPEFFEGSGTDVKRILPKLDDRESIIVLIGSCMLLSCWLNLYVVTNEWLKQYPSAQYPIYEERVVESSDLVQILEPSNKTPENGVLILNQLQSAVETALKGKTWSNVELWLQDSTRNVNRLGSRIKDINLKEFEERNLWKVQTLVDNIVPNDYKSGYKLDLFSVWEGPSAAPNGYYLKKSCEIEPIAESSEVVGVRPQTILVAEMECSPKISYFAGKPPVK